jgi:ketosteroid isomerase-like protein
MTNRNALILVPLMALAGLAGACSQPDDGITTEDLEGWLSAYGAAWESKDAAAVATIFTETALYQETPYADPFQGRAEISDYWTTVTADQDEIDFDFAAIAASGSTGVAEWSARFRSISGGVPVELDGVFVLEFADSGEVSSLREWWHVR